MPFTSLLRQPLYLKRMASSLNNPAWLEWMSSLMGGVSRQSIAATYPSDRFYCLLDELPLHLVPRHFRKLLSGVPERPESLMLNPDCEFVPAGDFPKGLIAPEELVSAFACNGIIAWVRDGHGCRLPFWLGPSLEALVNETRSGRPVPSSTSNEMVKVLIAAGILVEQSAGAEYPHNDADRTARASALFRTKGYAPLPSLLHPFHIAALRRYYRTLIRKGRIQLGDAQSSLRHAIHNEPVARFFHQQLTPLFSAIAGEPLKPSYVYLASYLSGSELKKHTDREQCEFSITLCVDFAPEPNLATPWPIYLDTSNGPIKVYQALGDGLAYRGTRLPHYRTVLGPGQTSTSLFFHYVSESFRGPLN